MSAPHFRFRTGAGIGADRMAVILHLDPEQGRAAGPARCMFCSGFPCAQRGLAGFNLLPDRRCRRRTGQIVLEKECIMEISQYLSEFYNNYDEDSRLASKHGSVEFLTTMRYVEKYIFEFVRKEDIDDLVRALPVTRLHYAAIDGCALFMREAIDAMDDDTFELYLKYHFFTCEREDLAGITGHAVDMLRK